MIADKQHIISKLKKDLLLLQNIKAPSFNKQIYTGLTSIDSSFPHGCFPTGSLHEFINSCDEDAAAASGFVSFLLKKLMKKNGVCIWTGLQQNIFAAALPAYGIAADKVIFVKVQREREVLWVMEEALKCSSLAAVIGQVNNIDITASRRLQLATEKSQVTGFVLRQQAKSPIASVAKWRITSLPGKTEDGMPGVGFPRWNVELLKIRNGKTGTWQIEFAAGRLNDLTANNESIENPPILKAV